VNVVRHNGVRVQVKTSQIPARIVQRTLHAPRDFRPPKPRRTTHSPVEQPIDPRKRLAARKTVRRHKSISGQRAVKSPRDEDVSALRMPVRKPPLVVRHESSGRKTVKISSRFKTGSPPEMAAPRVEHSDGRYRLIFPNLLAFYPPFD